MPPLGTMSSALDMPSASALLGPDLTVQGRPWGHAHEPAETQHSLLDRGYVERGLGYCGLLLAVCACVCVYVCTSMCVHESVCVSVHVCVRASRDTGEHYLTN